jgi:hypothetical protein
MKFIYDYHSQCLLTSHLTTEEQEELQKKVEMYQKKVEAERAKKAELKSNDSLAIVELPSTTPQIDETLLKEVEKDLEDSVEKLQTQYKTVNEKRIALENMNRDTNAKVEHLQNQLDLLVDQQEKLTELSDEAKTMLNKVKDILAASSELVQKVEIPGGENSPVKRSPSTSSNLSAEGDSASPAPGSSKNGAITYRVLSKEGTYHILYCIITFF